MKNLIFAILLSGTWVSAQQIGATMANPETFRGVLYDLQSGNHLEGAFITLECDHYQVSAMTDMNGSFVLQNIPKSCFKMKISMAGFEDKILENISSLHDTEYFIGLEQKKVRQPKSIN